MPERDQDAYEQVERELESLLRDGFGVTPADLSPTTEEGEISERNARQALARMSGAASRRSPGTHGRNRRRWMATAVAAAAAAVAGAVTISVVDFGVTPSTARAATPPLIQIAGMDKSSYPLEGSPAGAELEHLAELASEQPDSAGSGSVQYIETAAWWLDTEQVDGAPRSQLIPVSTQTFRLPGGLIRIRVERGEALSRDGDLRVSATQEATSDDTFPADPANPLEDPDSLPTNPSALREVLLGPEPKDCAAIEAFCLTRAIQSLNLGFVLDQDLQAALIRTLPVADDISYAGPGRDRIGRDVEVFVVDGPDGMRQHLVLFDAVTGAYVGDETLLTRNTSDLDVEAPAVIEFNAVTARELIARGDVPPPPTVRNGTDEPRQR